MSISGSKEVDYPSLLAYNSRLLYAEGMGLVSIYAASSPLSPPETDCPEYYDVRSKKGVTLTAHGQRTVTNLVNLRQDLSHLCSGFSGNGNKGLNGIFLFEPCHCFVFLFYPEVAGLLAWLHTPT